MSLLTGEGGHDQEKEITEVTPTLPAKASTAQSPPSHLSRASPKLGQNTKRPSQRPISPQTASSETCDAHSNSIDNPSTESSSQHGISKSTAQNVVDDDAGQAASSFVPRKWPRCDDNIDDNDGDEWSNRNHKRQRRKESISSKP